jgi:DNA repair photolyase
LKIIDEPVKMMSFPFEKVVVEQGTESSPIYRNLRRTLPQLPFTSVAEVVLTAAETSRSGDAFGAAKRTLYLTRHKGDFFKKCPGSEGQVCCNYFVINFASNCPMDCSYCYLQEYLADNASLKVFSNVDDLIQEADRTLARHRGVFFRIGTGEITDSLALEPYTGMVGELIPYFAAQPNVLLELKTKSDCVESLLDLDPKGRVVVAWSMNPQPVIDRDEHGTASLGARLAAARRCQDAGYRLGFHFDPIMEYSGWESDYESMLEQTFATIDWRKLAWVSLGVLRQTPALKRTMRARFPGSRLLTGEQVLCPDGKWRYFQPLRVEIYRKMVRWIRRAAPTVKIYLCMESHEVWEQVFGFAPTCEKELGNQMAPAVSLT